MKTAIRMFLLALACTGLGACSTWSGAEKGTAIGATGGAVVGNALTGGMLGTVGGAVAGGIIGHEVGDDQDRKKQRK